MTPRGTDSPMPELSPNATPAEKAIRNNVKPQPTVIPIASGKGGVGKSFLTANLAVALADLGHSVIAADLDLGGSNLYAFLGLQNRYPGIGDFLKARTSELDELLVPTPVPNLRYLAGDGRSPFMANIAHGQKIRLIRRLRFLPADYILLDLSAGSTFHTLDLFRMSPLGMVVTVPEFTAVINLLTFLKHTLIRDIEKAFAGNPSIREYLAVSYKEPLSGQRPAIETLKKEIAALEPSAGDRISALCRQFRPRIVFNQGEHPDDLDLSRQIDESLKQVLSIEGDYFGFIFRDPGVRQAVNGRSIYLRQFPEEPAARSTRQIAERVSRFWRKPIDRSALRIKERAAEIN